MAKKASFLSLPGELRNEIYDLYVSSMTLQVREGAAVPPALTRVSRQVRAEFTSVLHQHTFDTAPVEIRIIDWDTSHVVPFLQKLKDHSSGTTRHLKLYINLTTLYAAIPPNDTSGIRTFDSLRMRLGDQFFDIDHVFRLAPSLFDRASRGTRKALSAQFYAGLEVPGTQGSSRPKVLHSYLEKKFMLARERAEDAQDFIRSYWAKHAMWNEKLRQIQHRARMEIEEQQRFREFERQNRFLEVRHALALFRIEATADELAELQATLL
ncbi:hypothetical protein BDY17DRAFT_308859 [Neohortaea acidophila]|uniref:Uncharacterized protein n=1 Tax=Neohortaea acidophila TaxID=245834 RepID=A0A6A6Q1D8_9PEZI|nr:uncharacterized protein BDY17DRAFT_308859 [Neohortaea acidophila]KAF2485493.1 hypothetical protein BDY17DRAFT_308859 [Neohortaea acidophila]